MLFLPGVNGGKPVFDSGARAAREDEHVDSLNSTMMAKFPEKEKIYYNHDWVDDDSANNYPLDFLNSITPNGLPPHELKIKKHCPVILL